MLVDRFDTNANIWELFPYLKVIFKDLYNSDKSKNKKESSDKLWAVAFYTDPSSKWKNLSSSDKVKYIGEDFLNERKINFTLDGKDALELIDKYSKFVISKPKKMLVRQEKKLEERSDFIDSIPYNESTYEMLDKMMKETKKMWDEYYRVVKDLSEDSDDGTSMGGTQESASERHLI